MSEQTIDGNNRSNIIISGASDDTINAGGGSDLVISGAGDDTINGGRGSDIIISGSGDDVINGGSGSDILISGSGDDTVNGGSGNDIIISGSGDDTVSGGSGNDLILTGSGDDIVDGGAGHDVIDTGIGDDVVDGGSGHDVIMTGDGNDTATGDAGNDTLITGSGNDTVLGSGGHDIIISGTGDDTIDGGAGNDIILSGEGHDTIDGGLGHDVILSGNGNDTVDGAEGDDVIITGYGSDTIEGGSGYDWIHAGADDDVINSGSGFDYVNGGTGYDIAVFSGNSNDYAIVEIDTNKFEVTHISSGDVDSIVNVELFRFDDKDVDPANPNTNSDPVAVDDAISTDEDAAVTIDVLSNDSDLDGDALSVTSASAANGSVTINVDGTLDYTPNANFNGSDTISYEISDGNGGTSSATVDVTVNAVNDGPVATNDAVSTDEDAAVTIDVLSNDSDLDGDALSVTSASAANGSVTINVDGTLDYTPNANFNGSDTISYEISDGQGGTSTATVDVTVNAVNDGPVAVADAISTDEDAAVTIDVLSNDSDLDGDALSVTSASAANGSVTINVDGTLDYTPNANFNGSDTISYEISDGNGGTSTATVDVTVNAVNDGPVATNDAVSTDEDAAVTIDVLSNDSDLDGDALSVTSASAANGSVTINVDGTLDYTPNANFNGSDTISYEISDGNGGTSIATVDVTVKAVNDGPVAVADAISTDEDAAVTIDVLSNDSDLDGDALSVTSASAANGSVTINVDGTLDYTPNANFNGSDTISYEISDGQGGTSSATVDVTVNAVNDGPVATNDAVSTDEDAAVTIDVLSNDSDLDGDALSVTSVSAANGSVTINVDGTLDYTPNANFNGSDTISYEISDGNGGTSTATVDVTVNAVNDGPVAVADAISTDEDAAVTIDVLSNDSDLDGDALSVTSASAANGSVTINVDGTLDYTPNANFNGSDTISYEISDGNGGTATATVDVTVNAVNDGPVATNDAVSTDEDAAVTIDVLSNDSDLDGDALSVTSASAANGSVTINVDGTLDYTPNANFNGSDTISYEISDGQGGTSSATVDVTVNAVNDGPVAVADAISTDEDAAVTIDVLSNDSDLDGDALSVTNASAANGSVTINVDGTLDYTPNANFNGSDTISYEISDGNGGTATATVDVTVNAVNDGPVATNDAVSTDEDAAVTIDVLSNDSDLDGDALSVTSASAANGSVTINVDGTLDYTPNANFNGSDTISYEISDGNGGTSTATVDVTVNAVNDGPVAVADAISTDEDAAVTIDVLSNDSDLDGDTLSVTSASAANGSVTINVDDTLDYTPNANFNGSDTISYEISDGNGGTATATVDVTVNATNIAPTGVDDNFTAFEDQAITINVLANDIDADGDALSISSATALNGVVTINSNGTLTYTPNANFNGEDSITYEVSDGQGGLSTATANVTINAVNDGPDAVDDSAITNVNSPITIDVLSNDSDADGDNLSISSATALNGTVTINVNGSLLYVPTENFDGYDSITYELSDGNGDTSTATVTVLVNSKPIAAGDTITTNEDTTVVLNVLENDSDIDGGALSIVNASAVNGSVTFSVDGNLSYTPNSDFNGLDSIIYEISDGQGGLNTATVNVTVNAVNDGPEALDDSINVEVNTTTLVNVLNNDSDVDGDALSVTNATAGNGIVIINTDGSLSYTPDADFTGSDTISYEISDGVGGLSTATVSIEVNTLPVVTDDSITINEDTSVTINVLNNASDADGDVLSVVTATAVNGTVTINTDGSLAYTPNANFNGADTISYQITDGKDGLSSATVGVTVNSVNDDPNASNDSVATGINTAVTINVLLNDSDVEGDPLTITSATATNGTVSINNADGTLSYTPNTDFNGSDSISYEVSDGQGGLSTATVNVSVNTLPVAADDAITTNEDTAVVINVLSNDTDVDGNVLNVITASALNGEVIISSEGDLNYTPSEGFNGLDVISYQISDGKGGFSTAIVSVTVNAVQDEPVANNDSITTDENVTVVINVLENDSDQDGDVLNVTSATADNGVVTINADGSLSYTSNANFHGLDTISYEISDGNEGISTANVSVTVNAVNNDPLASDDVITTDEDTQVTIDVLANDSDIDGDALYVSNVAAANGTVIINAEGALDYTPNANFNGNDTLSYEISDGQGGFSSASVNVIVNAVNDAPVAADDEVSTDVNTMVTIDALSNDNDLDSNTLTVTNAIALNGSVTINSDNTLEYTPNTDFNGTDSITYEASDGFGGLSTATVDVLVNTPPLAVDDVITTNEDTAVIINVLDNDIDPDGSGLSLTSATATNGLVSMNLDNGTLTYTPDANFYGVDTIIYSVSDTYGGFSSATVAVTVTPVNVGPVASDDTILLNENTTVNIDVLSNDSDDDNDALSVISATTLNGTVIINPDGTLDYTPNPNFNGTDSINYEINDGRGGISSAIVKVTINTNPIAQDDVYTVNAGTNSEIASLIDLGWFETDTRLLVNDSDPEGSALTITEVNGQALVNGSITLTGSNGGTFTVSSDGTASFDASNGFTGLAGGETALTEITYTVTDRQGGFDTATVSVTVNGLDNDSVLAQADQVSVEDTGGLITLDVLSNDTALIDGDVLSIVAVDGNAANVGATISGSNGGLFTINADGSATFDTNGAFAQLNEGQATTTSVSYSVTGLNGETSTTTVSVEVVGSNNAPVAQDDVFTVNAGTNSEIASLIDLGWFEVDTRLIFNDSDPEFSVLTITEVNGQTLVNGSITLTGSNGGTFTVSSNGTASFDASNDFEGLAGGETALTEITYTVTDRQGGFDTATVSVTVNGLNDNPIATDDSVSTDESTAVTIDVLGNDSDVDGQTLTISSIDTAGLLGTVVDNGDGTITYDPNAQFDALIDGETADEWFEYTVADGDGGFDTAQVQLTILGSTISSASSSGSAQSESSEVVEVVIEETPVNNEFM